MKNLGHKIRIAGDWAPCDKSVCTVLNKSGLILNIEGPILTNGTEGYEKQIKAGPSIFNRSMPMVSQPSIAILANNHSMDFGLSGLVATINSLEGQNESQIWRCVGAGITKDQANKPLIIEENGIRIGILSRCESQFGIASNSKPGVAAIDASVYLQIKDLKKHADVVIVSIHAAAEMVPWPSPRRQATWRSLIDAGADVVHGHHAHVPQGWEEYNSGFIFYGLGNFCVDPQKWKWHPQGLWSLAPELELTKSSIKVKIETTVIEEFGESIRVREASDTERKKHMAYLEQCNRPLSDPILLEGLWQEVSVRMYNDHFAKWLGFYSTSLFKTITHHLRLKLSHIKRRLLGRSVKLEQSASMGNLLLWHHLFVCDSHNDAIGTALGVLGGELEDRRNGVTAQLATEWMVLN
jgi:poly-gamma-glutamate synthesis protein (capsule biosynthesis protein)